RADGDESGAAERLPIPRRRTTHQTVEIADDLVFFRQYFQKRDAVEQSRNLANARCHLGIRYVMKCIRTDDQVERIVEPHRRQLAEGGLPYIASFSETRDDVITRVEAEVGDARSEVAEMGKPCTFTAADVEHITDRTPQQILRNRNRHYDFAPHLGARTDAIASAVPAVEIRFVVSLGHARYSARPLRRSSGYASANSRRIVIASITPSGMLRRSQ